MVFKRPGLLVTRRRGGGIRGEGHCESLGSTRRIKNSESGTHQLFDDGLDKRGEAQALLVLVIHKLCKLGNALGVGVGLKDVALLLEQNTQLLVVCDDAIVYNEELAFGV